MKIYNAKCKLVGVENPRGAMSCIFRKPDQEIHPWYFGEEQMKRTCLWLKGLPRLRYSIGDNLFETNTATMKPSPINIQINKATGKIKKRYFTDCIIDNKLRTQESKSIFTKAVANAMAEQWTNFYLQKK